MSILWTIIIGFVAGIIAKLIYPGNKYEPTGFIWLGRRSGGIKLAKALGSSEQSLAR
jgi:uncharacterized membrane protein YeaQ/YmgE (transglycosylase-associated protein family)